MFSATSVSRKERNAELSRKLTDTFTSTKSEGGVTTTSESQTILPPPQSSQSQSSSSQTTPDPTVKNQTTEQPCGKCVRVLQELVAGLKQQQQDDAEEPAPLTLLKAIARGGKGHQQQQQQQSQSSHTENIKIEETSDGVRLELQVPTTLPNLLRRYSSIMRDQQTQKQREQQKETESSSSSSTATAALSSSSTKLVAPPLALATSVKDPSGQTATQLQQQSLPSPPPLTIELKCRKCSDQGPESQARAFLMGPQPLSIVLCQNRISSNKHEIDEILTHEFTHFYDVQTLRLDLQDCRNLAYSEVRAARHAECASSFRMLQPYCTKQKAIAATKNLFPAPQARKCIQAVFDQAFADVRPFHSSSSTTTVNNSNGGAAGGTSP